MISLMGPEWVAIQMEADHDSGGGVLLLGTLQCVCKGTAHTPGGWRCTRGPGAARAMGFSDHSSQTAAKGWMSSVPEISC